ncbi:MAG: flagellar export chaperone FliS [Planctomycetaceae bacterium]
MIRSDRYLESEVETASPHRLHLIVVDAAIRHGRAARAALEAGDREQAHAALSKCRDLVGELIGGLDPTHAPNMIERLKALFVFAYRNCAEAEARQSPQPVADALRVLETHRETWIELGRLLLADGGRTTAPARVDSPHDWTT